MPSNDSIYEYPEASQAKRKDTGLYMTYDEWWALNRLGKIKGVDYALVPEEKTQSIPFLKNNTEIMPILLCSVTC